MTVAKRNSTCQLSSSFVVLFGNSLNRMTKATFELSLQFDIRVLRCTCTDREKKASPLNAQWLILGSRSPPLLILL
ncbi:unnamed protein product [Fusarium graminearum]|nr:unnamed protein product [Fusarium graminearum]CAG2003020.1 unnamed protein product [Fusarium graminearum]VTO92202.1 unnamed protein product [Fusarium graminearum]